MERTLLLSTCYVLETMLGILHVFSGPRAVLSGPLHMAFACMEGHALGLQMISFSMVPLAALDLVSPREFPNELHTNLHLLGCVPCHRDSEQALGISEDESQRPQPPVWKKSSPWWKFTIRVSKKLQWGNEESRKAAESSQNFIILFKVLRSEGL